MEIQIKTLGKSLGGKEILKDISFDVHPKEIVALIGPNGSGKSTLLKCIYRVLQPDKGAAYLGGADVHKTAPREIAKREAVLAQHNQAGFDFPVLDAVLMGRAPYKGILEGYDQEDQRIAKEALDFVGMGDMAQRSLASLSGGERQRVMLARAIAQQTPVLILDEPTNHLDIRYQLEVMERVREAGRTVIAAIHDLNIAARYADRMIAIQKGEIQAIGTPQEILTSAFIRTLYGVEAKTMDIDGKRVILFQGVVH